MTKRRTLVLAGGTLTGGGSGFENLFAKQPRFSYEVVAVASHHERGGVWQRADRLKVPFHHLPAPWAAKQYQDLVRHTNAEFVACSGWLKPVRGLDPARTINIHPGALPRFGGKGMWGHHVHEATMEAYRAGEVKYTEINMHFVTDFDEDGDYDRGPIFFKCVTPIWPCQTAEELGEHVNGLEHIWQPHLTHAVVAGHIHWSGRREDSVSYPPNFPNVFKPL